LKEAASEPISRSLIRIIEDFRKEKVKEVRND